VTFSVFHATNLDHLKHIPFYRISTPKAPIYTLEEEKGRSSAQGGKKQNPQDHSPANRSKIE
jgi:hypothetical protein